MPTTLDFNLDNLPVDVFDLADSGLKIETLTGDSNMVECNGLSGCLCLSCTSWTD